MAVVAIMGGPPGHEVTLYELEGKHRGQGQARCTCGWIQSDVLVRVTEPKALAHIGNARHADPPP